MMQLCRFSLANGNDYTLFVDESRPKTSLYLSLSFPLAHTRARTIELRLKMRWRDAERP